MVDDSDVAAMKLHPSKTMSRLRTKHPDGACRKILLAIGTRPEAVKMAPLVSQLKASSWADTRVLATAQHRDLLDGILEFFGVCPDLDLDSMRPEQTLADLTARMLADLDSVLAQEQPDLVFAQGDTTTVFVTALACFYRRVPFAHVEAGLRTGDKWSPFPEEGNRGMVGRLADLHFAPTEHSREALLREAVPSGRIFVTGNTVIDALLWTLAKRAGATEPVSPNADLGSPDLGGPDLGSPDLGSPDLGSPDLGNPDLGSQTSGCLAPGNSSGRRRILLTTHRRENFGEPLRQICAAVREIVTARDVDVVCPVHPNPEVSRTVQGLLGDLPHVELCAPMDYPEFVGAMQAADVIWTDSGGVQEEAPTLGKPILVLRDTTERPEGVAAGTAKLVGTHRETIVQSTLDLLDSEAAYSAMASVQNPYGDGRAAERITATAAAYLGVPSAAL